MTKDWRSLSRLSILVAVLMMGSGCARSFSWGLGRGHAHTPHEPVEKPLSTPAPAPTSQARSVSAGDVHVVHLAFDVLRVDLPVEGIRHSRKIWNHVDELRIDSQAVALLARNGLRVGLACPAAWPAIQTIIETGRGVLHDEQLLTQRGLPLSLVIASIDDGETFFSYGRDHRLVGKTFHAGDKLLQLDYAFHPELGGCTDLKLTLEVQHDRGELRWERSGDMIHPAPAYDRHVFADLSVLLTLNPGEFVVIGPSDEAENEYLVGSRFFARERAGRSYETLLCITPRPYQTRTVGRSGRSGTAVR